jgi:hypothetical protein
MKGGNPDLLFSKKGDWREIPFFSASGGMQM